MKFTREVPFELRGQYGGLRQTEEGKTRMLLLTDDGEVLLKVPRELRHRAARALTEGQSIAVSGTQHHASFFGGKKRTVARIQALDNPALPALCAACPIQVCTKKNCWRSGGRQIWDVLEHEIQAAGLTEAIPLEGVDCLDECKRAPAIAFNGHIVRHCSPTEAAHLVTALVARFHPPAECPSEKS